MSRSLPTNPSLEQLKKQAKDLLKAHRSADAEAAERIKVHLPRLSEPSIEEILQAVFSLQEAQHVIAREYGCQHWEMLQAVVAKDIESVASLDDRSTQTYMRELDQAALVVALKGASEAVREKFLSNMSERVRTYITTEIEYSNADTEEVESTRLRMLRQLAQLADAGQLDWPFGEKAQVPRPSPSRFAISEELLARVKLSLDQLTPGDIAELWVSIAEQARREGILSLVPVAEAAADPFIREALSLAVDGCEPDLLRDILETRLHRAILPQQETRGLMIIEGLMAIMGGDNPGIVRHKIESLFLAQPRGVNQDEAPGKLTAEGIASRLSQEDPDRSSFEALSATFADMAGLARSAGLEVLTPLGSALAGKIGAASQLLRLGLELLPARDGEQMMLALKPLAERRLEASAKAHRMVIEGTAGVQAGKQPEEIGELLRTAAIAK